jgi:glycine cleavage system regulatory protein
MPAVVSPRVGTRTLIFELIGQDRPGIIRQVTGILTGLGASVESLSSGEETGAHAGERLFRAHVNVTLPDSVSPESAQEALEEISTEIMVDFTFA